ncbi:MAG: hypothetical protein EP347_06690 [Alphaproteobacteria bacterium]|nr:MAG: hypothetical protein EP347_06690 [Alphaproteobacteria bacterium]
MTGHRAVLLIGSLLAGTCVGAPALAAETEISGSVEFEFRGFFETPSDAQQPETNLSVAFQTTLEISSADRRQNFVVTPYYRWDQHDPNRSHIDLREARYFGAFDGLNLRVGVDKVFWGVTEAVHLVDIINQTDLVENIDGEEKLGQPMVSLGLPTDVGTFEIFWLPYFRERTFEDFEGRPRFNWPVDPDQAFYEDPDKERHQDIAVRWSHYIGEFDIGLAHFEGTGREPLLIPGLDAKARPVLIPFYVQISQTSIDLQATFGSWLYKFEGLSREEYGQSYVQATGGIEYSFYGLFGTAQDLGIVAEYVWDERDELAPTPYNNDGFLGLRWALNDEQSTSVLAGVLADFNTDAWLLRVEAERRLGEMASISLEAQFSGNVPPEDILYSFEDDDFIQLRLTRYY